VSNQRRLSEADAAEVARLQAMVGELRKQAQRPGANRRDRHANERTIKRLEQEISDLEYPLRAEGPFVDLTPRREN
jgi:hypothetical protein